MFTNNVFTGNLAEPDLIEGQTMDDKKQMLLEIIQPAMREILASPNDYPLHTYADIPQKYREKLKKIDRKFIFDDFVAVQSLGPFGDGLSGDFLLFMVDGLYFRNIFTKKFVKYTDILGFSDDKNDWLTRGSFYIHHKNGKMFAITTTAFDKDNGKQRLEDLLVKLTIAQSETTLNFPLFPFPYFPHLPHS
ncbi:MAG: hypothetical protein FWG64_06685 [Firmicutes bacterium]|nr:hypothetical protein [Bacillota bacterium]